ncbi:MAG TPA: zf-HC2 domain-containing protein, partial [Actinomycetota bacterium]|nr:zf-HC2 domain-containing protein [Actinomycetota bacterium]
MDERTHDELKDLIAAYALGAVPEDELPRIRSHILSCEECMVEADALVDAASSLALTVEPASLSTDFATRVLAAADTRGATPSPQPPSWSRRWRVASAVSIAALVVAVAVLGGVTLDLRDQ